MPYTDRDLLLDTLKEYVFLYHPQSAGALFKYIAQDISDDQLRLLCDRPASLTVAAQLSRLCELILTPVVQSARTKYLANLKSTGHRDVKITWLSRRADVPILCFMTPKQSDLLKQLWCDKYQEERWNPETNETGFSVIIHGTHLDTLIDILAGLPIFLRENLPPVEIPLYIPHIKGAIPKAIPKPVSPQVSNSDMISSPEIQNTATQIRRDSALSHEDPPKLNVPVAEPCAMETNTNVEEPLDTCKQGKINDEAPSHLTLSPSASPSTTTEPPESPEPFKSEPWFPFPSVYFTCNWQDDAPIPQEIKRPQMNQCLLVHQRGLLDLETSEKLRNGQALDPNIPPHAIDLAAAPRAGSAVGEYLHFKLLQVRSAQIYQNRKQGKPNTQPYLQKPTQQQQQQIGNREKSNRGANGSKHTSRARINARSSPPRYHHKVQFHHRGQSQFQPLAPPPPTVSPSTAVSSGPSSLMQLPFAEARARVLERRALEAACEVPLPASPVQEQMLSGDPVDDETMVDDKPQAIIATTVVPKAAGPNLLPDTPPLSAPSPPGCATAAAAKQGKQLQETVTTPPDSGRADVLSATAL